MLQAGGIREKERAIKFYMRSSGSPKILKRGRGSDVRRELRKPSQVWAKKVFHQGRLL